MSQIIDRMPIIERDILTLVKEINQNEPNKEALIEALLYNIIHIFQASHTYLALVYKLIFYTYNHNADPTVACAILNGFIQFGQSPKGSDYKPMIDFFVIEAFHGLLRIAGWAILKPCMISLKNTIPNFKNEPLFKHILMCIIIQLKHDLNNPSTSSELCYYLPNEKSYVLGWFSYIVAGTYYSEIYNTKLSPKQLRKNMMRYRKLMGQLRQNVTYVERVQPETKPIEENWQGILNTLETADYQWVSDLVSKTVNTDEDETEPEPLKETEAVKETEPVKEKSPSPEPLHTHEKQGKEPSPAPSPEELESEPLEADGVEGAEPLAENGVEGAEPLPLVKNTSWFYSLFGWSS